MQAVKIGWVGQTFALARCSETNGKGKKTRNRMKKEERKTMVESFINKYRRENSGNFPSLNLTHKEVGGSFYTVREIVRELIQENRVLAPGNSHSPVFNLEYSEDKIQPVLGTLSLDPCPSTLEINGYEEHETGGQIDHVHIIEESENFSDETIRESSKLVATGDKDTAIKYEQNITASIHEFSETKDLVFSVHDESSLSDANCMTDNMHAILKSNPLKLNNQLDSIHDISFIQNMGSTEDEQLSILQLASRNPISDSICLDEGDYSLSEKIKTKITIMGLEESNSTSDRREQTEINKSEVEDLQDGLSKMGATDDHLSSCNASSYLSSGSRMKLEAEGSMFSTSSETENNSVSVGKRAIPLETMPALSLAETSQIHSASSNVVEEVGTTVGKSISDMSHKHSPNTGSEQEESLHSVVIDSPVNPTATDEVTPEHVGPHIKYEISSQSKSPSGAKASGSPLSEGVKSDPSKGTTDRPHAAAEANPFLSTLKGLFRAFVKFLMSDF